MESLSVQAGVAATGDTTAGSIPSLNHSLQSLNGAASMNRTKIQYALIAQQQLDEAQEKVSRWSNQLDQRLENLNAEETGEFSKRVASLISHLAQKGPAPLD